MFESIKRSIDAFEFDFVSWRRPAAAISILLVTGSWLLFVLVGPNWGIDFTGGTEIHLRFSDPDSIRIEEVRGALRTLGLSDDAVQDVNGVDSGEYIVRIQDATFGMAELQEEVTTALQSAYGAEWIEDVRASAEVSARFDVRYAGEVVAPEVVQAALRQAGFSEASVSPGTEANEVKIEVPGLAQRIQARIATAIGDRPFEVLSIDAVGPRVGGELRRQGFIAIAATLALVLVYVAFRFDIGFAPGAVIALFHDVSITLGAFVISGREFSLPMIGALLTIVGYSLNDTIVIYDRIRENRDRHRRTDLAALINISISETLTRTVATSGTTILAIFLFLFVGGPVIQNFAFAMMLGIFVGTYSTVFVASPLILVMEDLKPWLSKLVVMPDLGDEGGDDPDGDAPSILTETEKRRRERAEADKREQTG